MKKRHAHPRLARRSLHYQIVARVLLHIKKHNMTSLLKKGLYGAVSNKIRVGLNNKEFSICDVAKGTMTEIQPKCRDIRI